MTDVIATSDAPAAIGPYVQARTFDKLIFVSGQLGMLPSGELPADFESQARNALNNLRAILETGGSSLGQVLKTTVFLSDLEHFTTLNTIYAEYFPSPCPARSCFEVARLPKNALVEIEAIAHR